jgi:large subunit ribosomal protein L18e
MKSKRKLGKQITRKTKTELVETLLAINKNDAWRNLIGNFPISRRNKNEINLEKIDSFSKEGETILFLGKVLSLGEITKKIKIIALGFSENAKEKLLKSKSEIVSIMEEIKKNPSAKGIKVLNENCN